MGTQFPDGQKIFKLGNRWPTTAVFQYIWSWDTLQLLIGAKKVMDNFGVKCHLHIKYMYGMRADRKFNPGEPAYFKDVIAPLINNLKFETVSTFDTHSDVVEACIDRIQIRSRKDLVNRVVEKIKKEPTPKTVCLVVPDAGAVKKSHDIAGFFDSILYATKHRDIKTGEVSYNPITNLPTADNYLIVDDICDGGATFLALAKEIRKVNINARVSLYVSHGLFSKGLDALRPVFTNIYTTNSVNFDMKSELNFHVENVW